LTTFLFVTTDRRREISSADIIQPGVRTSTYRTGTEQLVVNKKGESSISAEDYAFALVDESETAQKASLF